MIGDVSDVAVSGVCALTAHLQQVAAEVHGGAAAMAADSVQVEEDAGIARQSSAMATDQARELTAAIGEIAQQMERAARSTREAVGRTRETEIVFSTLSGHVQEVSEVAKLIAEIAGRTNLLAPNATIEAARAGEAGRGFAVVAGEVKILAQETERRTALIALRVSAIEASTRAAIAAVVGISASITEIDGVVAMVAAAVEQQAASTAGIADTVGQMSQAADRVVRRMHVMSASTRDCETGAGRLATISNDVNGQVAGVKSTLVGIMCDRVAAIDRRSERRVRVQVKATIRQAKSIISGTVSDISVIDARFVPDGTVTLQVNDVIQLQLPEFPIFEARVVRTDKLLVQLDFHECPGPTRDQLQSWINRTAHVARAA